MLQINQKMVHIRHISLILIKSKNNSIFYYNLISNKFSPSLFILGKKMGQKARTSRKHHKESKKEKKMKKEMVQFVLPPMESLHGM